jgi:quercetin dioxygenase-like cupin family protein
LSLWLLRRPPAAIATRVDVPSRLNVRVPAGWHVLRGWPSDVIDRLKPGGCHGRRATDLVRQGKVRYIGSSSFSAGEIVEAQWSARERRLERFRTEQPPYSLLVRGIELDVLPTARRHGIGILTYSPLAGGWLSGSWSADSSPTSPARQRLAARFDMTLPENQRKLEAVGQLANVADEAGVSMIELAIAFVVNHPAVTSLTATRNRDMQITRSGIDTQKGPADWFTGDVYVDAVAAPAGSSTFAAAAVHFTPGARTAWHTHPHGQTIFVTEGVGLCQREDGPVETIRPGDRVFFEPGENHWHGAAPNRFMIHVAMQQNDETGSPVAWGRHVTDEEYSKAPAD